MRQQWVLDWEQAYASGPALAGGKGWNLGRLARYGFRVPSGGVLSTAAYTELMANPTLAALQAEVAGLSSEAVNEPEALRRLEAVQQAIRHATFPPKIAAAVESFLAAHDLGSTPIAVRSSATAEDGTEASFAGIHQSRLRQTGIHAVLDSILHCYASLWTPQAVAYRRRFGLRDEDVPCAVVLCRMIGAGDDPNQEPVAAGVAFSCDPLTGRVDVTSIGAVHGSGEKVVDGSVQPEEILVLAGPRAQVLERRGESAQVLTDEQALRLSELVQRIEWALGEGQDRQDVEWAFDGTHFWVVQSRPVTRLRRYTFPGAHQLPVVWSNANLKDALPGVLSTLGWSMTQPIVRHNLFSPHRAAGYSIPPGLEAVRRFAGRAYFDLTTLFWAFYDGLGMSAQEFNRSMGGHQPEFDVPAPHAAPGRSKQQHGMRRLRILRTILRLDKELPVEIQKLLTEIVGQRSKDLRQETLEGLRRHLMHFAERSYNFGPRSMLANTSAGLWHQMLEQAVRRVAPDEAANLTSLLVAGSGNVSAEHGYRLFDLAAAARNDLAAQAFLQTDPLSGEKWRDLPESSAFRQELERFLNQFGHRGVYEVDVGNPRWIEDPTYLLEQVRHILATAGASDPRRHGKHRREQAEATLRRRTFLLRPIIHWLAQRARHGFALRESAKSALVAHLEPCRAVFQEVGRRMTESGKLDAAEDIFELAWSEVDAYLRGLWNGEGARNLVEDRLAMRERWLLEAPPDVMIEGDAGSDSLQTPAQTQGGGGNTLQGSGVAPGTARGTARILRHPSEGAKLQPGDVLVAPSTDPGWTPLFLRAAAIVMEVGGYHSHGATVAREYGIPAVANIPGLLGTIADGDVLIVEGDTGRVVRSVSDNSRRLTGPASH